MKKSKITGITQKAKNSVDKSESSINRFARFMGVMTKSVTKDIPDQKTLKKAGLFAKNFGGGRSSKVNKMLLGGALMLPLVLGQMLSKERSTEELLQNQYGGNEKAMQSDLSEEQKIRDEGLEKVETTADENKDISLDRKKDLQAVSQKDPEEIPKSEVDSDDTTLERMNDKLSSVDEGIDKKNSDQFVELMDRFVFLAKVGAFNVDKGPTLSERIDQTKANVRKFTGGKVDDGVFSLGFGINIPNVFSDKGRQKLGLGSKDNSKDQQSRIQEINDSVDAQIAKNEKAYADAGSLLANEEATKKYLRTKSELEKLKKRLQDEPLTVLTEMMSDANPSSVSSQSSMLSLGGSDGTVPTKVADDLDFQRGVDKLAQKYNISVQDLYAVMSFESGGTFDPAQKNIGYDGTPETGSGATGLIQFMPDTAKELGTSTNELAGMTRTEQLKYVDKHFANKGIEGGNLDDLYMSILFPVAVGKPDDFVLFGKGAIAGYTGTAYTQNAGLDKNGDGSITKAEAAAKVRSHKGGMGLTKSTDPMGDQSSLTPNNPNQVAQFVPEKYMPYDDPSKSSSPIIALTPTPVNTGKQPIVTGSGDGGSTEVISVQDTGALFSQIQLNSLALT